MHPFELGAFFFGGVELDDAGAGPPAPMDRRVHQRADVEGDHRLRQLGDGGRAARLRLVLDHRAPLPARGLRGRPQRHPAVDVDRRPHVADPPRHDVQRRAAVEPAAAGRGLLDAAQPVRRPRHPRRRPRHGAARGAAPQRQGRVDRLLRQPRPGGRRRPQPAGVRGVDGDHPRWRSTNESFSYHGEHFQIPVPGIPDRGSTVQALTLVPRPLYPYEIWQAVTSPPTLEYVPVVGHGAVFWNQHHAFIKRFWDTYGERYAAAHDGDELAARRQADARHRRAHRGHPREGRGDGDARPRRVLEVPRPVRLEPRLHGSPTASRPGRADPDARPSRSRTRRSCSARPRTSPKASRSTATCSACEHLTIFPHLLGDPYKKADEQMARFIEEVLPLARATRPGRSRTSSSLRAASGCIADRRCGRCGRQAGAAVARSGRPRGGPARTGAGAVRRRSVVTIRPERSPARISVTRSAHSGSQRDSSSWRPGRNGSTRWR